MKVVYLPGSTFAENKICKISGRNPGVIFLHIIRLFREKS